MYSAKAAAVNGSIRFTGAKAGRATTLSMRPVVEFRIHSLYNFS
jgi:hypothetical protein